MPPRPPGREAFPADRWAFFLDLDGTLYELAASPGLVQPEPDVAAILDALGDRFGGAVAVLSGRGLDDVRRLGGGTSRPMAAVHGLVRQCADGTLHEGSVDRVALREVKQALDDLVERRPGLLLEDKLSALALHYRNLPELAQEVTELAARAVRPHASALALQPGDMVVEVKPLGADKGTALSAFLREAPFRNRRPVMVGDDLTDEHGFAAAIAAGGLAVRIGRTPRETAAGHGLPDVAAARAWLRSLA